MRLKKIWNILVIELVITLGVISHVYPYDYAILLATSDRGIKVHIEHFKLNGNFAYNIKYALLQVLK